MGERDREIAFFHHPLSVFKLTEEERHIAASLRPTEIYQVSQLDDERERRDLINAFQKREVTTADIRRTRSSATQPQSGNRTKKKRTVDGAEIRIEAPIRLTNDEVAKRLVKYASILRKDGRGKQTAA